MKLKKLANDKYKLTINGNDYKLHEQIIIDYNVLYKKDISEELIEEMVSANDYFEKYDKALKYTVKKVRSELEVKKYLKRLECSAEEINKIVDKLVSINLINEELYVKSYIADKINFTNDGLNKIKNNLIRNGASEELVLNNIEAINENERKDIIIKLINKKLRLNKKYSESVIKQKIISDLITLGYSKKIIEECFEGINFSNDNITKEANKLKTKLSKKYKDNELIYQLKNKLYQKGFKKDDIENYLLDN